MLGKDTTDTTTTPHPPPNVVQQNGATTHVRSAEQKESLHQLCSQLHEKISAFLASTPETELLRQVQHQTKISLQVIQEALQRYSFDELAISFNGGKDCLVLLIIFLAELSQNSLPKSSIASLNAVYVMSQHPFPEVDEFVDICVPSYHLDLARYALPMKKAFETYLEQNKKVKAIFVGTRRTDPHGEFLTHFDRTDHGWPDFMRVHPVIDWHYQEVWTFLRALEIPYCSLYDKGYTSLGGTTDTHPNPVLLENKSGESTPRFKPAYELVEDLQERLGRDSR
ncbi:hypothetical protein DFP73DRAFT_575895 [Morchella snyderi]|nr:hypothetical protein DFP73DRAFT_575895 [Morchella snyderi]